MGMESAAKKMQWAGDNELNRRVVEMCFFFFCRSQTESGFGQPAR